MILLSISEIGQLAAFGERMARAAEYITTHDIAAMEPGRHDIDGDEIFVNVQQLGAKSREEAKIETHDKYIDIQLPFSGEEEMGWITRGELPQAEYNAQTDMTLYDGPCTKYMTVRPGECTVFFPSDGHAPGIVTADHKKAIVKVKI